MSKIEKFAYPTPIPAKFWGCSLWSRFVLLGSAESEMVRLIAVKLISQNSNIYDHGRYLNVTDRRADRQIDNLPWQYHAPLGFAR